ncbi:hypothetical protein ATANTOWER_013716, partial [Ataeniobius toweri]|nr:hypothetical protein [Ataeniobius toweri]
CLQGSMFLCACVCANVPMPLIHQQVPVWSHAHRAVGSSRYGQNERKADGRRVTECTQQKRASDGEKTMKKKNNIKSLGWIPVLLSVVPLHTVLLSLTKCMEGDVQNYSQ